MKKLNKFCKSVVSEKKTICNDKPRGKKKNPNTLVHGIVDKNKKIKSDRTIGCT